jgi:Ser/Thr protein kinase RdoA (MazF antagonist)
MTDAAFAVIYSTLTSEALVSRVLPYYSLGSVTRCQFWNRGLSDVYLLDTQTNPYVLRVSHTHWRSKSDIDFELELLEFLQQRYIPVAYPLRTQDGQLSVEINAPEGKRYAALFTYAPGRVALGDLTPTQATILGETVAKLHLAAVDFRTQAKRHPLSLEYLLDNSLQIIAPFLDHKPQDLAYLVEAIAQLKHQLQDFPKEPPFWGICWGDPHSGNAHFTPDNKVTLFDFDQCGYGWRIFEIAKFFQVALCTGVGPTIREAFVQGYQSVQELAASEMNSLQAFTQTAFIWAWAISLNCAMLHHYSRLDDHYFHHRLEQLKMLKSPEWQLF